MSKTSTGIVAESVAYGSYGAAVVKFSKSLFIGKAYTYAIIVTESDASKKVRPSVSPLLR